MLNVALTGNIAAGKSTVAEWFRDWGATVVDADQLAREAQHPGSPVLARISARFGAEMILPNGDLDRPRLREQVMSDPAELAALNAIVHPAVDLLRQARMAEARARGVRIVVNVIPLLFEARDPASFDAVVLVDAPEELRLGRLMETRGLSRDDARKMIRAQRPSTEKRAGSDHVIENDGDRAQLESRARQVWEALTTRT